VSRKADNRHFVRRYRISRRQRDNSVKWTPCKCTIVFFAKNWFLSAISFH